VFICYKETDPSGARTHDSVIANDIYYQLTEEGFKVFYAAITLEGKLGSAYEPIIFAALNSAKVMLSIGTKPEYFNAVWVKNEWSRFLKIIKNDHSKVLIPCYRDMDAYELPEEFAHLQAQDMSKIGFINDLIRGIKKVLQKDEPQPVTVVKETVVAAEAATNTAPLLKRAFMFLEDGEWRSADEYCEKVLDIDPKNGEAYLCKLLADLRIKTKESVVDYKEDFSDNKNYKKIMSYGSEEIKHFVKNQLNKILDDIASKERQERIQREKANALAQELEKIALGCENKNENEENLSKLLKKQTQLKALMSTLPSIIETIRTLNRQIAENKREADKLIKEKESLGIFAGKRKKEINRKCDEYDSENSAKNKEIKRLEEQLNGCRSLEDVKREHATITAQIDKIRKELAWLNGAMKREKNIRDMLSKDPIGLKVLKDTDYKILMEKHRPGKKIKFGRYKGKEIEWIVLQRNIGSALLISADVVDCGPFNVFDKYYCEWYRCDLRKWLNETFLNLAFTNSEQEKICYHRVYDDQIFSNDKVYVLSIEEAKQYSQYVLKPCYNINNKNWIEPWWLRSKGSELLGNHFDASYVTRNSDIKTTIYANLDYIGIRPVIWLSLN